MHYKSVERFNQIHASDLPQDFWLHHPGDDPSTTSLCYPFICSEIMMCCLGDDHRRAAGARSWDQ